MKRFQFILLLLAVFASVKAQIYIPSAASLYIGSSVKLAIDGDLQNAGVIDNEGIITLSGNMNNQNNCIVAGELQLIGADQTIYHKNTDIATLTTNGIGVKTLLSNISITKQLNLTKGLLTPKDSSVKLLMKSSSSIDVGNDDSYVNGMLYWEGTNTPYFPIGKGSLFAPAEFHNVTSNNLVFGVELFNPSSLTFEKDAKVDIIPNRYYKMNVASGSFTQGFVSLSYFPTTDYFSYNDKVGVVQASDSIGNYELLKANPDITSRIAQANIAYTTSNKPVNLPFFAVASYKPVDFSLFYLPNAMAPFAPDSNDRAIRLYGGDIFDDAEFSFVVQNLWGNTVFHTTSRQEMVTKGWDGTNSRTGRKETTGQYIFNLTAKTVDGAPFFKAGSLWIID